MVVVAQLVRASDCGSEGRRFEPAHPPKKSQMMNLALFFSYSTMARNKKAHNYLQAFFIFVCSITFLII
jgi:hypothetical protein